MSPSLYVKREATEHILAELLACGREPARPAVLFGPPGIGKSLMLRLAGEQLSEVEGIGTRVVLTYPILDVTGLCMWVFDSLGSPCFEDPVFAFEAYLEHLRKIGSSLLLLIDDLSGMPLETVRWLGRYVAGSKGELRLIATALDNPVAYERLAPLGPACETIALNSPMQPEESAEYVRDRLRHADAPDGTRARFDPTTVAELHRISNGNPRELNAAAVRHLAEFRVVRAQAPHAASAAG